MFESYKSKKSLAIVAALIFVIGAMAFVFMLSTSPVTAEEAKITTTDEFYWFDPFPQYGGRVVGETHAKLVTNQAGASLEVQTEHLTLGDAVTLWWVIFNNPEQCEAYPDGPCTLDDLMGNTAAVGGEVTYADGHVIGYNGKGNFAGHLPVGPTPDGWFKSGFNNPTGAEIHFVVHTHGRLIPHLARDMTGSYRGGCHDDWFINEDHPAYDDGVPGPNQCVDLQFGILQQ